MATKMAQIMNRSEQYGSLAAFTVLAPLSVGGLLGLLILRGTVPGPAIDFSVVVVLVIGILAFAVSLFHLGRPWRAPLAILHLSTSWLSREVILFGLFLLFLMAYSFFPVFNLAGLGLSLVGFAGVLIGLASTIATGETYRLRSRPSWDRWMTVIYFLISALSTGVLFGFFIAHEFSHRIYIVGLPWVATTILLILSLIVSLLRTIRLRPESTEAQLSRQLAVGSHLWLFVIRTLAIIISISLIWIGNGAQYLSWLPALIGEFCDRILFFNTVIPVTPRGRYIYG